MAPKGDDAHYLTGSLEGLQEDAAELLIEDHFPDPLPSDAFVFFMHQGYQFNFFRVSEGDDPPVYRFYEGKDTTSFALIYPLFTSFLLRELTDYQGVTVFGLFLRSKNATGRTHGEREPESIRETKQHYRTGSQQVQFKFPLSDLSIDL